jgi:hypothetical protein
MFEMMNKTPKMPRHPKRVFRPPREHQATDITNKTKRIIPPITARNIPMVAPRMVKEDNIHST